MHCVYHPCPSPRRDLILNTLGTFFLMGCHRWASCARVLGRMICCACAAATPNARGVWVGQALTAMRLMAKEKAVLPELTEQFEAAELWLSPMRP